MSYHFAVTSFNEQGAHAFAELLQEKFSQSALAIHSTQHQQQVLQTSLSPHHQGRYREGEE
jgi:hypothetical protein